MSYCLTADIIMGGGFIPSDGRDMIEDVVLFIIVLFIVILAFFVRWVSFETGLFRHNIVL